jgi:hypothetical protein
MCLDYLVDKKEFIPLLKKEGNYYVGYKYFRTYNKKLAPIHCGKSTGYKTNTWLNEKDFRDNLYSNKLHCYRSNSCYKPGFHIFLNDDDFTYYSTYFSPRRKIYFKNIVSTGKQKGKNVVVATDIFIPSIKKPRKPGRYNNR